MEELETTEEILEITEEIENTTDINVIHNDLSIIVCFLVFFTLVIILKYSYKFFNMIFKY